MQSAGNNCHSECTQSSKVNSNWNCTHLFLHKFAKLNLWPIIMTLSEKNDAACGKVYATSKKTNKL